MNTPDILDPEPVFAALNRAEVRYLVVGGLAVIAYGPGRTTDDIDIIVDFEANNLRRLKHTLAGIGYVPKNPTDPENLANARVRNRWLTEKGMRVYSFVERQPPFRLIDIMVKHRGNFAALYRRKRYGRLGRIRIPLVPVDHLMRMKRIAGRPKDLEDLRNLQWFTRGRQR